MRQNGQRPSLIRATVSAGFEITINEFFGGTISTNALSWLPLLKQYWNRFSDWLPRIDGIIKSVVSRSPPHFGRRWMVAGHGRNFRRH
jgi:hypothetical protein